MTFILRHHRAFFENLGQLHDLEVSWDGKGGMPLMKKALLSAMEFFGRRPDLIFGSKADPILRGGLQVGLFRGGMDVCVQFCPKGSIQVSCHKPKKRPDFMVSHGMVTSALLKKVETFLPFGVGDLMLDVEQEGDVLLTTPFDGFKVLRLRKNDVPGGCRLFMGRTGAIPGLYAFHDALDLPEDLPFDQPLTGWDRLSDLMAAYRAERVRAVETEAEPTPA